jgi:hypothetical protein
MSAPHTKPAFVYLLAPDRGPVKIGISSRPDLRASSERYRVGARLHVVATYHRPTDALAVEFVACGLLRKVKLPRANEWFNATPAAAKAAIEEAMRRVDARDWSGLPRNRIPKTMRPPAGRFHGWAAEPAPPRDLSSLAAEAEAWAAEHPEQMAAMMKPWSETHE